jgi:hypothetical protein
LEAAPAEDEDEEEGLWCVADDVEREREGGASAFLTPASAFDFDPAGSGPADVVSNAVFVAAPFMAAPPLNNENAPSKSTQQNGLRRNPKKSLFLYSFFWRQRKLAGENE